MTFQNKKTQKIISSLLTLFILIPSVLVFSTPKKAEATGLPTIDIVGAALTGIGNAYTFLNKAAQQQETALSLKSFAREVIRVSLQNIAKRALASMTKSTINWINTGFHGAPLFLENPGSFFKDIAKFQIKDFIQITGYDNLKYPFGKQYALDIIQAYKRQLSNNAEYSLSQVTNDPALLGKLRVDFNTGGWNAFLLNTQYPQNNPIGYNIIAGQELSVRLDGTFKAPGEKINEALQQGLGFLSPQVCPSSANPNYPEDTNPFNPPTFSTSDYQKSNPMVFPHDNDTGNYDTESVEYQENQAYAKKYEAGRLAAQNTFNAKYSCPGGLKSTTPGSVAQDYIARTLFSGQEQGQLSAALGNSISSIFDALLSKFLGDGLSALASKINPSSAPDNFSYYGQTFGSPLDAGTNRDWSSGPDEEIDVVTFKREVSGGNILKTDETGTITSEHVAGAIELTQKELDLISNSGKMPDGSINSNKFGILEIINKIWPVAQTLDMCIPGPNKGWENRLDEERDRIINSKLVREVASDEDLKVKAVNGVLRDFKFAVTSFKDWVNTKMIGALPNSILFIDAVKGIDGTGQQLKELSDRKLEKTTTLARLKAIEQALAPITKQPDAGTPEEKNLITIRKQYNAIATLVGNAGSVEDMRSQLDLAKAKLQNLLAMENKCETERVTAGWTGIEDTTGRNSVLPSAKGIGYTYTYTVYPQDDPVIKTQQLVTNGSEVEQFCDLPAISGYSHGDIIRKETSNGQGSLKFTFRNLVNELGSTIGNTTYDDLPMLKATGIYGDHTKSYDPVDVDIECSTLFKTNDQIYKHAGEEGY